MPRPPLGHELVDVKDGLKQPEGVAQDWLLVMVERDQYGGLHGAMREAYLQD